MTNKKKTSRQKRTLIGAVCVAAVIMAGSTFAWFTSQDEVTNRLTASADYGVSIVEDFTPPKDMTPGQEVTKTASVVNTGNIDAFVRVALENYLTIKTYGTADVICTSSPTAVYYNDDLKQWSAADGSGKTQNTGLTAENYAYMAYNGLITEPTISDGKVSSKDLVKLNRTPSVTATSGVLTPDEVTTLQAGGQIVVAASNSLPVPEQVVQSGDYISTEGLTYGEYNDNGEFLPKETGLYLFRRTAYGANTGNKIGDSDSNYEYSGYYYVAATSDTGGKGTYYALATKYDTTTNASNPKSTVYVNAVITEDSTGGGSVVKYISGLKLKTTETKEATTTAGNLAYKFGYIGNTTANTKAGKPSQIGTVISDGNKYGFIETTTLGSDTTCIEVTYNGGNVKFYIELASGWTDKWVWINNTGTTDTNILDHFYLKDDLEAGQTSPALIKSVTLNPLANQNDFVDLTYDINVVLDSIQVTYDGDNMETVEGVKNAWDEINDDSTIATMSTSDAKEIASVSWTFKN
ncbi:MAG: BsaA family SipW-dependent biofilm matrix protein [Oscillospiraceae bacterium]|nr:BsaA family SipW-dependent biofilm matrix protein [Oscillospiraceae bacterium]